MVKFVTYQSGRTFDDREYAEWIKYLYEKELISLTDEGGASVDNPGMLNHFVELIARYNFIKLTVQGWDFVRTMNSSFNSLKVFIAMAFTDQGRKELPSDLKDCLKNTIGGLGWEPIIVMAYLPQVFSFSPTLCR